VFAVADVGVRPGVLIDLLEQALLGSEQDRVHERETMRLPDASSAPSGKPRSILHKPERPSVDETEPVPVLVTETVPEAVPESVSESVPESVTVTSETPPDPSAKDAGPSSPAEPFPSEPAPEEASSENPEDRQGKEDDSEVDRILLAKEFAGLLQVPKEDDEASG
jgi:hypothetical protein